MTIAVVDGRAVWRVETTPGFAPLSGAWLLDDTSPVTADAHIIEAGSDALERIHATVADAAKKIGARVQLPDLDKKLVYTGEPEAERAWRTATLLAELVEAWNTIETRRRQREGGELQPLPLN